MTDSKTFKGKADGSDLRVGIVVSGWYPELMARLVNAAMETLLDLGVSPAAIDRAEVPGSFELPFGARTLIDTGRYDCVICFGVVIRGETTHYDYVAGESARGIQELNISTGVPVLYGVLTCENREQALARSGGAKGNKGAECARAAIELANLVREIRKG